MYHFFTLFKKLKDDFFISYSEFESEAESMNSHIFQKLTSLNLNRRYLSAQMFAGFKKRPLLRLKKTFSLIFRSICFKLVMKSVNLRSLSPGKMEF